MPSTSSLALRPSHLPGLELHCPRNIESLLELTAGGACPFAGGTDALLWASHRGSPQRLVWVSGIDEFQVLESTDDRLRVGAAVSLSRIVRSSAMQAGAGAVVEGAQVIGSVQIRNQATLVGNLCTASPAGDSIPGLLVHDAEVEILAPTGTRRRVDIRRFLLGPGRTALVDGELVASVSLARLGPREFSTYLSFTQRKALDLAFASVAARIGFAADGRTVSSARLALGAVGPTAIEAGDAAMLLVGRPLGDITVESCARAAADTCAPITDHRAGADYRRHLVASLVRDAIAELDRRARASQAEMED